ncbi:MAG: hypothetical protein L3J16_00930 [Anaerolineales bacterium]|nr:hypothetical protein [Anaerolineales bacterium]
MSFRQKSLPEKILLSEKTYRLTLLALALFGLGLRLRHYLANRSLWLDEAMLALNILDRSFGGLTQQPMAYEQGAPIGFVFFVKAATLLFGDSEYVFRLYSLLASCLALGLMVWFAQQHLRKSGALLAVALFSSGGYLIYYSAETKQYMGDVAVTLLLLLFFSRQIRCKFSQKEMLLLSVVGVISLWFSHAAVFVVAPVGIVLALHYAVKKERQALQFALANLCLSSISALLLYRFHLRPLSASNFLRSFWEEAFMPLPPTLKWFQQIWEGLLADPLGLNSLPLVIFVLFLIGFVFVWKQSWQIGTVFLLTLLFPLTAAGLQKYPVAGRMLMFSVPIFFLVFGAGLDAIGTWLKKPVPASVVMLTLSAYLLYFPLGMSLERLRQPLYREHIRPTMAYLKENIRENDLVYVYYFAEPAFLFYLPKYHLENSRYILGQKHQDAPELYLQELDTLDGERRVWVLFSHVYEKQNFNEKDFMLNHLDQIGKKDREYRVSGTSVYLFLYDLQ